MYPHSSTSLLVSVRSAEEARAALAGGADIIDVKEPARGSLGAADAGVVREVIEAVGGRCAVSVALGELAQDRAGADAVSHADYCKIGLYGAGAIDWRAKLAAFFARQNGAAIAVAYADAARLPAPTPPPREVLRWAIEHRAAGVLIDTFDKSRGDLLTHCEQRSLASFIADARSEGLLTALAGSLRMESIPTVLACRPDVIAVRGAVCVQGERTAHVDGQRVRDIGDLIAAHAGPPRRPRPLPATGRAG